MHSPYVLRKQGETILPAGSVGQRYGINPLDTSCHSPYVLRKQGETILPAGSVGSEIQHQPPRHVVPLPLYAPQTGGDNLASRQCVVRDTVSTPSSRCATPPMCSANRGRQSCLRCGGSLVGMQRNVLLCSRSFSGVNRGGVPQGRRGQRYSINPLVTLCHSPYMLRKQGETIMGSEIRYQPPRHFVPLPLYASQTGGDILPAGGVVARIGKTLGRGQRPHAICIRRQKQIKYNPYLYNHIIWRRKDAKI